MAMFTGMHNDDMFRYCTSRFVDQKVLKMNTIRFSFIFIILVFGVETTTLMAEPQQAATASKEHSMTGCLGNGNQETTFQLTNLEKGPSIVAIVESTANLKPHVSHKVEITGTTVPGENGIHTMKVTAVKHISAKCP